MKKKKLVYLTSARIPDDWGHVIQILTMCEAFALAGIEVELVAPHRARTPKTDPFEYAHIQRVFTLTRLPCIDLFAGSQNAFLYWLRTLSFLVAARVYLFLHQYDALYTRESLAGSLFTDFYYEAHSIPPRISSLARFIRRAKGIVAVTGYVKQRLVDAGIADERIMVAGDAVTPERFAHMPSRDAAREALGIATATYVMGYSGTLKVMGQEKGVGTGIRALAELTSDVLFLVVGGEPEDIAEYRRLAESLSVADRVTFIGKVPHARVPEYLAAFDVAVATASATEHSAYYGSPLKMFEYMAAGIPMIVSDLPALREVLTEETTVFIAPADPHELAQAVMNQRSHPGAAILRAQAAKQLAHERFTWNARAHAILAFIIGTQA